MQLLTSISGSGASRYGLLLSPDIQAPRGVKYISSYLRLLISSDYIYCCYFPTPIAVLLILMLGTLSFPTIPHITLKDDAFIALVAITVYILSCDTPCLDDAVTH